jgi:hypothetical protein
MSLASAELPDDPDALRAFARARQGALKAAETAVQLKALEIEKLRFQIVKLRRMQFGRSSERISRQIEQLELRLEELQTGAAAGDVGPTLRRRLCPSAPGPSANRCLRICRTAMWCISLRTTPPAYRATIWVRNRVNQDEKL